MWLRYVPCIAFDLPCVAVCSICCVYSVVVDSFIAFDFVVYLRLHCGPFCCSLRLLLRTLPLCRLLLLYYLLFTVVPVVDCLLLPHTLYGCFVTLHLDLPLFNYRLITLLLLLRDLPRYRWIAWIPVTCCRCWRCWCVVELLLLRYTLIAVVLLTHCCCYWLILILLLLRYLPEHWFVAVGICAVVVYWCRYAAIYALYCYCYGHCCYDLLRCCDVICITLILFITFGDIVPLFCCRCYYCCSPFVYRCVRFVVVIVMRC